MSWLLPLLIAAALILAARRVIYASPLKAHPMRWEITVSGMVCKVDNGQCVAGARFWWVYAPEGYEFYSHGDHFGETSMIVYSGRDLDEYEQTKMLRRYNPIGKVQPIRDER